MTMIVANLSPCHTCAQSMHCTRMILALQQLCSKDIARPDHHVLLTSLCWRSVCTMSVQDVLGGDANTMIIANVSCCCIP